MRVILSALIISIAVSGCGFVGFPGAYKIGIEQGNIVTQEMIDQLEPGMSRRQVRFVLGTANRRQFSTRSVGLPLRI